MKNKGKSEKLILTSIGYVRIKRSILIPIDRTSVDNLKRLEGNNVKSVIPLDQALKLEKLPLKMTIKMMLKLTKLAISLTSFEETERVVFDLLKIKIGDDAIRKVVKIIGKIVYDYDEKNIFNILSDVKENKKSEDIKKVEFCMLKLMEVLFAF